MPQPQPRPAQSFNQLRRALEGEYQVRTIEPDEDIPAEIDTIVLAGPANLSREAVLRLDQFLMRGGGLIVLAGRHRLDLDAMDLMVEPVTTGLEEALATYGVEVPQALVLDERSDNFPVPVTRDLGGMQVQEVQLVPYPFFVHARRHQLTDDSPVTTGLRGSILHWASPIELVPGEDVEAVELVRSSSDSWLQTSPNVRPDFRRFPERGFGRPAELDDDERGPALLAAALSGRFTSHFARDDESAGDGDGEAERLLERSVPDARIAVIGSSSFVSDELVQLARQTGSDLVTENFQLVQNLVDWSVTDTDLLSIRSSGGYTRVLEVDESERRRWEIINYGIVVLLLLAVIGLTAFHRRTLVPMALAPPKRGRDAKPDGEKEDEA